MADVATLWQRGLAAIRARHLAQARGEFEALLRLQPAHVPARLLLASVHLAQGSVQAASRELLAAAAMPPREAGIACRLAQALHLIGENLAARELLALPALATSNDARALLGLAHVHQSLNQHVPALALMERALALGLDTPDLRYFRALQLQFHGRLPEAEAELERCLVQGPTFGRASLTLARLRRATPARNQLDFIAQRLTQVATGSEDEAAFQFARYAELEALGRDEEAWDALARGNALMRARLAARTSIDEDALVDALRARVSAEFLRPVADSEPPASSAHPQPIFIVGMPRSGTTLLESILGRHPQVAAAGELSDFSKAWRHVADVHGHALVDEQLLAAHADFAEVGRRYLVQTRWRAQGRAFYVDKLPPNFWLVGLIRKALPQARIVHMSRDPLELCFSSWRALFGDTYAYSYDLNELAAHHARYRRLMQHWREAAPGAIHEVDYAALVAEPEAAARELLAHCGLPWHEGLLDAGHDAGPVATLSSAQVRAPITTSRRHDWQRYAGQLDRLRRAL
jgi:tetratricopeptide (TPR) repeat protein